MVLTEKSLYQRNLVTMVIVSFFVVVIATISLVLIITHFHFDDDVSGDRRLNVLFIVVDDLRPTLGCYGDKRAITPNIDQLASQSMLFTNAYAQQALCAPSRTSFLTGRRPDTLHLYDTGSYWRQAIYNFTSMPQHFKENGYETISVGKVFHHGIVSNHTDDYPYSWSREPFRPSTLQYKMAEVCPTPEGKFMNLICPVDVEDQPGGTLPDLEVVDYAIEYLNNKSLSTDWDSPFFLGVGFYKPHIPFKFPREYLDLYPIDTLDLAPNNTKPTGMPSVAWNPWSDLRLRHDVDALNVSFPYDPLPDDFQKLIRQSYYAATSYMDEQLGKLLEALEETGYASNTVIVLLGDHGWSLGEHGEWSKYSNFDVSLNVPLIYHVPGVTNNLKNRPKFKHIPVNGTDVSSRPSFGSYEANYIAHEMVELVDLFPTLAETVDIPVPPICSWNSNRTMFCSEGVSFYPILQDYALPSIDFTWKTAVFSQYPRPSVTPRNDSDQPNLKHIKIMGYTIKDEYFRYTRWVKFNNYFFRPNWAPYAFEADELYDEMLDPEEIMNLADHPEHVKTVKVYFKRLKRGWRWELPYAVYEGASNSERRSYRYRSRNRG